MKRLFTGLSLMAALLVATSLAACGDDDDDGADKEVQLSEADNGKTVTVALGREVVVALASNPTTGYSWAVVRPEPANLELQGEPHYVAANPPTPVVGAGGTEVFTFKATKSGTSTLSMAYRRSFEPTAPPAKTFTVTVEVR